MVVCVALVVACVLVWPVKAGYGGGTEEPDNPYQISTAKDLNDVANHHSDLDKHFIIVNDISLADYT